eukprot:scaffold15149_cov37-Cyclotella_meneghiniana.AAC.1
MPARRLDVECERNCRHLLGARVFTRHKTSHITTTTQKTQNNDFHRRPNLIPLTMKPNQLPLPSPPMLATTLTTTGRSVQG